EGKCGFSYRLDDPVRRTSIVTMRGTSRRVNPSPCASRRKSLQIFFAQRGRVGVQHAGPHLGKFHRNSPVARLTVFALIKWPSFTTIVANCHSMAKKRWRCCKSVRNCCCFLGESANGGSEIRRE